MKFSLDANSYAFASVSVSAVVSAYVSTYVYASSYVYTYASAYVYVYPSDYTYMPPRVSACLGSKTQALHARDSCEYRLYRVNRP